MAAVARHPYIALPYTNNLAGPGEEVPAWMNRLNAVLLDLEEQLDRKVAMKGRNETITGSWTFDRPGASSDSNPSIILRDTLYMEPGGQIETRQHSAGPHVRIGNPTPEAIVFWLVETDEAPGLIIVTKTGDRGVLDFRPPRYGSAIIQGGFRLISQDAATGTVAPGMEVDLFTSLHKSGYGGYPFAPAAMGNSVMVQGSASVITTNASGDFTITFLEAFSSTPSGVTCTLGTTGAFFTTLIAASATDFTMRVWDTAGNAVPSTTFPVTWMALGPNVI